MALDFVNDAISLSGLTGSKLKCQIISQYYPFWWRIASGGDRTKYDYLTTIVELDAATGEVHAMPPKRIPFPMLKLKIVEPQELVAGNPTSTPSEC